MSKTLQYHTYFFQFCAPLYTIIQNFTQLYTKCKIYTTLHSSTTLYTTIHNFYKQPPPNSASLYTTLHNKNLTLQRSTTIYNTSHKLTQIAHNVIQLFTLKTSIFTCSTLSKTLQDFKRLNTTAQTHTHK